MNPTNPQKLISTFLILATAVSSSVLIFATTDNSAAVQSGNTAISEKLPENAFADESIKQIAGFSTYNTLAIKEGGTRDNLTDYFAEKLLGQLAEDNDTVALADLGSGVPFVLPDMGTGLDYFMKDPTVSLIASVSTKDIKTKKGSSVEDIQKYFEEITPITEAYSKDFNDRIEYYSKTAMTAASFTSLDFIISNAVAKLYNVKAPTEVADYHLAIIKTLKTRAGLTGVNNDPLRSYFYAKNFGGMVAVENSMIQDAASNLDKKISLLMNDSERGMIARYFAVNTAHAQWITTDLGGLVQRVTQWLTSLKGVWQQVLDYAIKIATEVLKDQLIHKLVQQTINWANNGFNGKPQYAENFGKVIDDAVKSAGDRVLSDAMTKFNGGACPTLKPLLEITFQGTAIETGVSGSGGYSCTIDQMGANIDDFKNSFANGGWISYRSMLTNPEGTYIGATLSIADKISREQEKKDTETKQEISTGGGFLNMKKCKSENVATGADAAQFATIAEAKSSLGDAFVRATCPAGGPCTEVVACESTGGNDPWETTTPGQIAGQAVKDSLGKSPIDRIVNANDITGLISALVNAALTKVVGLAQEGLAGLTTKELERKDGSVADICAGSEDPEKCKEEMDGATAGIDAQKAQKASEDLGRMISFYSEAAGTSNEIISKGGQAKFYLEQASSTCSAIFLASTDPDITDAQFYVDQNYDFVTSKVEEATNAIPEIVDAETGMIAQLQNLSNAIKDKDLDALLAFGFGITPTGDTNDKKVASFVSQLSDQMDLPGSAFAQKFSTPIELNQTVGTLKSASQKIGDDACSIIYTAKRINPDPNSCGLLVATKDCKAPTP